MKAIIMVVMLVGLNATAAIRNAACGSQSRVPLTEETQQKPTPKPKEEPKQQGPQYAKAQPKANQT